jgi:hypothetical protein
MENFKRQNHCSECGAYVEKPTYAMLTYMGNDYLVGLCPKCLSKLVASADPKTITTEKIDITRVSNAKRR